MPVYRNLSTDFTRSSSFLMALLANKTNPIDSKGKNIPISFFETKASPDKVCIRYTNKPNKIRFIKIVSFPKFICNFRLLNLKIVNNGNNAEMKNNIGTNFRKIYDCENKSIARTPSELVSQRSKKKTITPEQTKATNKYIDCILCIIYRSKIKLLFLKKKSWNLKKNYIFVSQPR